MRLLFDPYSAQLHLLWRNRINDWRTRPSEAGFVALAWSATIALMTWLALAQLQRLAVVLEWLREDHAWATAATFGLAVLVDQQQARRRQRQIIARDWLSAQPINPAVRRRRRLRLLLRLLAFAALASPLLLLADASPRQALVLAVCAVTAAVFGNLLGDIDRAPRRHSRPRETAFQTGNPRGSVFNWQCIEAGASVAPRHLAPLLLVVLLVPRGPLLMALVALTLLLIATGISAWRRAVLVIVQADRWLLAEPVPARVWLLQSLRLPLLLLLVGTLALVTMAWIIAGDVLAVAVAVGMPALGMLYLAVVTSGRKQPRRLSLRFAVHVALLAACAQAFPPLALLVWGSQWIVLFRRSLRP